MSKYLELFNNGFDDTITEKLKPENWPYIGYDALNDTVAWSTIVEKEEPLVPGFVDLGLSVMWASCDVGAASPEGEGTKYSWGEDSWETIPLESDPVYMNSDMEWKEALQPRTPSPAQVQELLDNTTATEEVLNGVSGVKYTASNGNSIFVSNVERWTNAMKMNANPYIIAQAVHWMSTSGLIDNNTPYSIAKTHPLLFRGVCSNLPKGGARVLEHGAEYVLEDMLYCFPKTWTATEMKGATDKQVEMYVSNVPDFLASSDDVNVLYVRSFELDESNRVTYLSGAELSSLAEQATDDYLYVRFSCPQFIQIAINPWNASECADQSFLLKPNIPQSIEGNSSTVIYRARYEDFSGYDLTIKWEGISRLPIYIARKCDFSLTTNDSALLLRPAPSIASDGSLNIEASKVDAWESRIGDEGYFYVRFNPNNAGDVTFMTEKEASADLISTTIDSTETDCGCETE